MTYRRQKEMATYSYIIIIFENLNVLF